MNLIKVLVSAVHFSSRFKETANQTCLSIIRLDIYNFQIDDYDYSIG